MDCESIDEIESRQSKIMQIIKDVPRTFSNYDVFSKVLLIYFCRLSWNDSEDI